MAQCRTLTLSQEQKTELIELRNKQEYVRERCAALLKIAGGQSAHQGNCTDYVKRER